MIKLYYKDIEKVKIWGLKNQKEILLVYKKRKRKMNSEIINY